MTKAKILVITLLLSFVFFVIGNSKNEVLEIQNNGATMCLSCIGLE